MPYTGSLLVVVDTPTKASEFNNLAANADFLRTGLNKGHDFSADSVADGKHFAYSGKSMRLQLQIAQEYSMAGYVSRRPPARIAGFKGASTP